MSKPGSIWPIISVICRDFLTFFALEVLLKFSEVNYPGFTIFTLGFEFIQPMITIIIITMIYRWVIARFFRGPR